MEGGKSILHLDLMDLWRFRDLLVTLATRDLKLRYKQTALGVVWVVLQPLLAAGIFSIVFGLIAGLKAPGDVPYFVFSFAGMIAWTLFSGTLIKVSGCLVGNSHLISKVYFPRLVLPLSSVGSVLVDFLVALAMMVVLLIAFDIRPGLALLMLPVWMVLLLAMATGVGLITSALAVSYRDINYILPVFVQMLLYASPVAYSVANIPERVASLRWFFYLNPLTGLLEGFRWSVLGGARPGVGVVAISVAMTALVVFVGLYTFKKMEKQFADIV
jgi:lipopolysaccharide transport system permease protein